MQAPRVIKPLDIVEITRWACDMSWSLSRNKRSILRVLQNDPHRSVVVAVGAAAHRSDEAVLREHDAIRAARILRAAVGVDDQAWSGPPSRSQR